MRTCRLHHGRGIAGDTRRATDETTHATSNSSTTHTKHGVKARGLSEEGGGEVGCVTESAHRGCPIWRGPVMMKFRLERGKWNPKKVTG